MCVLNVERDGVTLGGSAGLAIQDGRPWFSVELRAASVITAVTLVRGEPAEPFRAQLFGSGGGVALRPVVRWLPSPDVARLDDACLSEGALWLEVVTSEGTVRGRLQEIRWRDKGE